MATPQAIIRYIFPALFLRNLGFINAHVSMGVWVSRYDNERFLDAKLYRMLRKEVVRKDKPADRITTQKQRRSIALALLSVRTYTDRRKQTLPA